MIIHTMNEHLDMQANKLNAKYHLYVQHLTDARTLKLSHQGYKMQQGHKSTKDNANQRYIFKHCQVHNISHKI